MELLLLDQVRSSPQSVLSALVADNSTGDIYIGMGCGKKERSKLIIGQPKLAGRSRCCQLIYNQTFILTDSDLTVYLEDCAVDFCGFV